MRQFVGGRGTGGRNHKERGEEWRERQGMNREIKKESARKEER